MPTIITPTNPRRYDLSEAQLLNDGGPPLYIGTTVAWRFQVRDEDDEAVDLTGATIQLTITRGANQITRVSGTAIAGAAPAADEIEIDADQSAEDENAGTGKGWYQVNFASTANEIATLNTVAGTIPAGTSPNYEIIVKLGDGTTFLHFKGRLDAVDPDTTLPI